MWNFVISENFAVFNAIFTFLRDPLHFLAFNFWPNKVNSALSSVMFFEFHTAIFEFSRDFLMWFLVCFRGLLYITKSKPLLILLAKYSIFHFLDEDKSKFVQQFWRFSWWLMVIFRAFSKLVLFFDGPEQCRAG